MEKLLNAMRAQAGRQAALIADSRMARVTSYDPKTHSCTVKILPEGDFAEDGETGDTGWIPIQTIWSGPGWGVFCPPSVGDQVFVAHAEGDPGSGQVIGRVFDASHLPLAVESGEFWMVHASGSFIKLTNDSAAYQNAPGGLHITAETSITGSLDVSGNVTVGNGASGTFTSQDGLAITVQDGIVTNIF